MFMVPPSLLMGGVVAVFGLYTSMRHTQLPPFIYFLFPVLSGAAVWNIFDLCHDGMLAIWASEDSLHRLRSAMNEHLRQLSVAEKRGVLKRAKALRPAFFHLGHFTQFSIDVPVETWDEIVNQMVFLLTL